MKNARKRITISNSFHRTEVTLSVPWHCRLSRYQIRRARRELCGVDGCQCGGVLGERGQQEPGLRIDIVGNDRDGFPRVEVEVVS